MGITYLTSFLNFSRLFMKIRKGTVLTLCNSCLLLTEIILIAIPRWSVLSEYISDNERLHYGFWQVCCKQSAKNEYICFSWWNHYSLIESQNYTEIPSSCLQRFPDYNFHEIPIKIGAIMIIAACFYTILFDQFHIYPVWYLLTDFSRLPVSILSRFC